MAQQPKRPATDKLKVWQLASPNSQRQCLYTACKLQSQLSQILAYLFVLLQRLESQVARFWCLLTFQRKSRVQLCREHLPQASSLSDLLYVASPADHSTIEAWNSADQSIKEPIQLSSRQKTDNVSAEIPLCLNVTSINRVIHKIAVVNIRWLCRSFSNRFPRGTVRISSIAQD